MKHDKERIVTGAMLNATICQQSLLIVIGVDQLGHPLQRYQHHNPIDGTHAGSRVIKRPAS